MTACVQLMLAATLWMMPGGVNTYRSRRKPAISPREMNALLDYHNRVRSQVFPPAANMEYMVRHLYIYGHT